MTTRPPTTTSQATGQAASRQVAAAAVPATAPATMPAAVPADLGPLAADLRVALFRAVRRLRGEKSDSDLSDSQYAVLSTLDRHGSMTSAALADHERVRPPSMTRTVACLLEAGLVERSAHPVDGRAQVVSLSAAGRDAVVDTRRLRDEWLCRRLAELDEADRATLARAVDVLSRVAAR